MIPILPLGVFLAACTPNMAISGNRAPEVRILTPLSGQTVVQSSTTAVVATVVDPEQSALENLDFRWTLDQNIEINVETTFRDESTVEIDWAFPIGPRQVTLTVTDPDEQTAEAHADFLVVQSAAPTITFTEPAPEARFTVGELVPVRVSLSDDQGASNLQLSWSGNAATAAGLPSRPSADGTVDVQLAGLEPGAWTLRLTALDAEERESSAAVAFYVDPAASAEDTDEPADTDMAASTDHDRDGDGHLAIADGGDDCDDTRASVRPGAEERCNGRDDDCDSAIDESGPDASQWYADADSDGYGDADAMTVACAAPAGSVANDDDCNDEKSSISPGKTEVCDGIDQDCDGFIDEDSADPTTWYTDADADGFGTEDSPVSACVRPSGTASLPSDCDDTDAGVHPDATETCDGVDEDCDTAVDEGLAIAGDWFTDLDDDGFGDAMLEGPLCRLPATAVDVGGDCDDDDPNLHPDATEMCDGVDENCNAIIDDNAADARLWYADSDSDTYGSMHGPVRACVRPSGYVSRARDCDDTRANAYPGAPEHCDGLDEDCDGLIDENAEGVITWYADEDGDAHGTPHITDEACTAPDGFVGIGDDCDDGDDGIHPGAAEQCNGVDDDCDHSIDEGLAATGTWYVDDDGDDFGNADEPVDACSQPAGTVDDSTDCDDARSTVHPGANEYCNGIDDDCDTKVDDDTVDPSLWFADADGDDYGDADVTLTECAPGDGWVKNDDDCDDSDPDIQECVPPRIYTFPALAAGGSSPNNMTLGAFSRAIQYVHPGSGSGLPTTPISIHEVRFRRAINDPNASVAKTIPYLELWIGRASGSSFDGITSFAGMISGSLRQIHAGSLGIAPQSGDPLAYNDWVVELDPPFYFDPASGPLLLDFRYPTSTGWADPYAVELDCRNDGWVQMRMNGNTGTPTMSNNATGCGYSFQIMGY